MAKIDLSQSIHGSVLQRRSDGVTDYLDGEGNFARVQNIDGILRSNHADRMEDRFRGFRLAPAFRKVASIPVAVFDIARSQGIDLLNDPDALRQFLNDPDNAVFRTGGGKV